MAIADAYSSHTLAVAIGLTTVISIVGIIVIEFLALGRLANFVLGVPIRTALAVIAVPFIAVDAISLVNPEKIYVQPLRPSLIALFTAQAIVFLVYPLYRRRTDPQSWVAPTVVALLAAALMIYGLYHASFDDSPRSPADRNGCVRVSAKADYAVRAAIELASAFDPAR